MHEYTKPFIKFFIDIFISLFSLIISYAFLYNFQFIGNNTIDILSQFSLFTLGYMISSYLTKNYASVWAYASLMKLSITLNVLISFFIHLFLLLS